MNNNIQTLSCLHLEAKTQQPKKLAIMLHGFGASAVDLFGITRNIADQSSDVHFILPNAPNICAINPDGFEWFDLSSRSETTMINGLEKATIPLNITIDMHLEKFNLEQNQLIFLGFSQGAMLALYAGLRRVKDCCSIVSFSGAIVETAETLGKEMLSRPNVCLIHGKQDDIVPFAALANAREKLQINNIPAEIFPIGNLGHAINQKCIEIATEFLHKES